MRESPVPLEEPKQTKPIFDIPEVVEVKNNNKDRVAAFNTDNDKQNALVFLDIAVGG